MDMNMDDLTAKLTELLQNPDGMETVKNMAASFLNTGQEPAAPEADSGMPFSPDQLQSIMRITSAFKSTGDDMQTRFLLTLKPLLSEEKQVKADRAIKMLKMIKILPLVQDSGLFSLI